MLWLAFVVMLSHMIVASKAFTSRSSSPALFTRFISKYRIRERYGTHILCMLIISILTHLISIGSAHANMQLYRRQFSVDASSNGPILSDITLDFLHSTNNNENNTLSLSHLEVANSRITPYWIDQLKRIDRNIAKNLISQLIPDNPLGLYYSTHYLLTHLLTHLLVFNRL